MKTDVMIDKKKILFYIVASINAMFLASCLGFIPGVATNALDINFPFSGKLMDMPESAGNMFYHDNTLFPAGSYTNEGFAMLLLGRLFCYLGLKAFDAMLATFLFLFLMSYISLIYSIIQITNNRVIAIVFCDLFFLCPFMLGQSSNCSIFLGMVFIPVIFTVDLVLYKGIFHNSNYVLTPLLFVFTTLLRVVCCGLSSYLAVMCAVSSCLFWFFYCLMKLKTDKFFVVLINAVFYVILPWIIGMLIMYVLTPKETSSYVSPLEFYNGSGVDLVSCLVPNKNQLISKIVSSQEIIGVGKSLPGDGSFWNNYLGYSVIILAVIALCYDKFKSKYIVSMTLVGVLLFVISLGPALKINAVVESNLIGTYSGYLLGMEQVKIIFPWYGIFKIFPLNLMRAVFRWLIIPQFLLIILASKGASILMKRNKKTVLVGIVLIIIAVIEFYPVIGIKNLINSRCIKYNKVQEIRVDTVLEIDDIIKDDSIVAICNYGYDQNAFLSAYISSEANFYTYQGCGDKAVASANDKIPINIRTLQTSNDPLVIADCIIKADLLEQCEYVLFPYFQLRQNAYYWPTSREVREYTKGIADEVNSILGGRYNITFTEHYMVVELEKQKVDYSLMNSDIDTKEIEKDVLFFSNQVVVSDKKEIVVGVEEKDNTMYICAYLKSDKQGDTITVSIEEYKGNNIINNTNLEWGLGDTYQAFEKELEIDSNTETVKVIIQNEEKIMMKEISVQVY